MILDTHVHTSEGSIDGRISIFDTVAILKQKGYQGVVVTDHNSYKGYEAWVRSERTDFTVIRGLEYDTLDAGHMLVLLPDGVSGELFTHRGMRLSRVIDEVHARKGVIGVAHPYQCGSCGMMKRFRWNEDSQILRDIDFIEGINSHGNPCTDSFSVKLAEKYQKVMSAGSDSHTEKSVGLARTMTKQWVYNTTDLIDYIQSGCAMELEGEYLYSTFEPLHRALLRIGAVGYSAWNSIASRKIQHGLVREGLVRSGG